MHFLPMTVHFELDPLVEHVTFYDLVYWNFYNRSLKSFNSLNMSEIRLKLKPKFFGSEYGRKFQELSSGISVSSCSLSHSHLVDAEIMMNAKRVENFILQRFKKYVKFRDHRGFHLAVSTVLEVDWNVLLRSHFLLNPCTLDCRFQFRNSVKSSKTGFLYSNHFVKNRTSGSLGGIYEHSLT